jgi:hypothetical protein
MPEATPRSHIFHADAKIVEGSLSLPLFHTIQPPASAQLPPIGGYRSESSDGYRLEGVFSYKSARTQVAGNPGHKPGHGWGTLCTTVIEGLNVLEILTADRVVGQIITEHPLEGYVPTISFLGTRFENLRIAGHKVDLELDTNILGDKPADDAPYTKEHGVVSRISSQYDRIRKHKDVSTELAEQYNRLSSTLKDAEAVECSLVNQASGPYPGHSCGHVITIPGFGTITLAKLSLKHEDWCKEKGCPKKTTVTLTMVDLKLGCPIQGAMPLGTGSSNGSSWP